MCVLDSFGKIDAVYYLLSPYYNDVLRLILCESEQMLFIRHIIIRSLLKDRRCRRTRGNGNETHRGEERAREREKRAFRI